VWSIGRCQDVPGGPICGPLSALQHFTGPFGSSEIFVPHPILAITGELIPTSFDGGLSLVDSQARLAVVCRIWRRHLIGNEYFDDREHRIDGIELLVRPDLFNAVSSFALSAPILVTVVVEDREP
jgi:hypothetical protein